MASKKNQDQSFPDEVHGSNVAPPNSRDNEMAVLCCLMNKADTLDKVLSRVNASDFYYREHQIIFEGLQVRLVDNEPVDTISLAEHFKRDGDLTTIGDVKYLTQIKMIGASPEAIESYISVVKETSHKRKLRMLGLEIAALAIKGDTSADEIVTQVDSQMTAIHESNGVKVATNVHVKHSLGKVIDRIDALFNGEMESYGVPTGFAEFDEATMGLQAADLIILAGRPSMGKTTFAMNIAENAAIKGKTVQVFSLEMPTDKLTMRMVSSLGRIDSAKLKRGALDDEDWLKLTKAVSVIGDMNLYIDDTPGLSINEFRARARKAHKEHNLDLIVIDYLQLMKATGKVINNRTEEVAEISKGIKAVAKELNIPIIALSQLNRSLEQRPNKRPVMSDLRESGSIEQDADLICFVYRDEVYNEDSPDKGKAEIIIGKNRDGAIGMVPLLFEGQFTRFHDIGITADATHDEYGQSGYVLPDDSKNEAEDDDDLDMPETVSQTVNPPSASQSDYDDYDDGEDGLAALPQPLSAKDSDDRNRYL